MKSFWMNHQTSTSNIVTEEKKISRTSQIIATDVQRAAIFALERHVFGSKEGYFAWRESGRAFPAEYKAAKNFILNYPWGNEEFYNGFISMIPKAQVISESTNIARNEEIYNSCADAKAPSVAVGVFLAECIRMDERKGSRSRGTARNPMIFETYKARVSCVQSRARRTNYNESMVAEIAVMYTKHYNERFNTNFEVYHSKKKSKKN